MNRLQHLLFAVLFPALIFSQTDTISPKFKDGEDGFAKFVQKNINYPQYSKENGIQGTVFISFIVTETGDVDSLKIVRSSGFDLDDEVIRLIKLTNGQWESATVKGKIIRKQMYLPIKFTLRDKKPLSEKKIAKLQEEFKKLKTKEQ